MLLGASSPISPRHDPAAPLACEPLKRKPAARGTRAPRTLSIVDVFCLRPWLGYAGDSVAPDVCHLALVAARALLAAIREGAQNGSRHATIRGELTGVGTAAPLPRCDELAQLSHDEQSD